MLRDPEMMLLLARQRQAELRREVQDERLRAHRGPRPNWHCFSGAHLHIGGFVVAVGRALCDEDAPRARPLHP